MAFAVGNTYETAPSELSASLNISSFAIANFSISYFFLTKAFTTLILFKFSSIIKFNLSYCLRVCLNFGIAFDVMDNNNITKTGIKIKNIIDSFELVLKASINETRAITIVFITNLVVINVD